MVTTLISSCGLFTDRELLLTSYPELVATNESFNINGEYLTDNPGAKDEVEIFLSIKEVNSEQEIYSKTKELSEDRSQQFSFAEIELDEINDVIYYELRLIANGEFLKAIDNQSQPSFLKEWQRDIVTTYFEGDGLNTWGNELSEGNPYFFALPYRDFYQPVLGLDGEEKDIAYGEDEFYGVEDVKNRWIEIRYWDEDKEEHVYVYAQWRDVGPWNYYDPYYVFEQSRPYAELGVDMGWSDDGYRETNQAGLDVSPKVMSELTDTSGDELKGLVETDWRFVEEEDVPDGPWKEEASYNQYDSQKLNLETETLRTIDD